jgi:hypothetical protein
MGISHMLETLPFLDVFARALKGAWSATRSTSSSTADSRVNLLFFLAAVIAAFLLINHRAHRRAP